MNKIKIYNKVTSCQENRTQNFLDGFKFIKRYTLFFNLLKEIEGEVEVIPSFPYSKNRVTDEEQMKVFYYKLPNSNKSIDEQINDFSKLASKKNINSVVCKYNKEKDALQVNLL